MKECSSCGLRKEFQEFYYQNRAKNQLHAQCKACYKEYRKTYSSEHYQKYGNQYRDRARLRRTRIKKELQQQMLRYLQDKACEQCGENDIRVLDFDHRDPSVKSFGIARGLTNAYDWKIVLEEIEKCRILCANCHRKHTATQVGSYKLLALE